MVGVSETHLPCTCRAVTGRREQAFSDHGLTPPYWRLKPTLAWGAQTARPAVPYTPVTPLSER